MQSLWTKRAAALVVAALIGGQAGTAFAHSGTKEEQDACTPDVMRLCSAYVPDETLIVACLNRNHAKLSPSCRKVMAGDSKRK
jgi:hypothetical protein